MDGNVDFGRGHGLVGGVAIPPLNSPMNDSRTASRALLEMNNIHRGRSMGSGIRNETFNIGVDNSNNDNGSFSSVSGNSPDTTTTAMSRIRDIYAGKDKEQSCPLTIIMVRQCAREELWNHVKFLTNDCIKNIDVENKSNNKKNALHILLKRVRRLNDTTYSKLRFWEYYAKDVQKELNIMKSTCTKHIKDNLLKGMW